MPVRCCSFLQHLDHFGQVLVRLGQRPFGRHVAIVEAVVADAEFLHELEGHPHAVLGVFDGVGRPSRRSMGSRTGRRRCRGRRPVGDAEWKWSHRLAFHLFVGVVFQRKASGLRDSALRRRFLNVGEGGSHGATPSRVQGASAGRTNRPTRGQKTHGSG